MWRPLKKRDLMKLTNKNRSYVAVVISLLVALPICAQNSYHRDKRENGPIALSGSPVINGVYENFQIATIPNQGGPYHYLTNLPTGGGDPDFTPDGRTIYFWTVPASGPDQIFTVPVEGGALTQIQTGCSNDPNCLGDDNPAVSPNGRELLAVRALAPFDNNGCPSYIGIMGFHADGSHARQITASGTPACGGDFQPRWSPDGTKIVFQTSDGVGPASIWIMDREGAHRRRVTPIGMDVGNPDWSPNGRRIVFQSPAEPADDQTPQQIYTIHPDGTHLVQLTHYEIEPGVTVKSFGPHWSPDGRKFVFAHVDSSTTVGPDGLYHADLFVMNPDDGEIVQIDFSTDRENNPAWGREVDGREDLVKEHH
jgi:Tol biopolymer transport system component